MVRLCTMAEAGRIISAVSWVRRGVAAEVPHKLEVTEDELGVLIADYKKTHGTDPLEMGSDNEDDGETEGQRGGEAGEAAREAAHAMAGANKDDKYNMATYDDDEWIDEDEGDGLAGLGGLAVFAAAKDDPHLTNLEELEDEEEIDDNNIKMTDNLLLVGVMEDDYCRLEVNVFEGDDDRNTYVHHEIPLPALPLCFEWLDFDPDDEERASCVAIGTMGKDIEIWDLDVIDGVEPLVRLKGKPSKKKKNKKGGNGHSSSVLGLSWNEHNRHVLASGSADHTVKLWDLATQTCADTLEHHNDKVQCVAFNPAEPVILATGSFDRTACVLDCRQKDAVAKWTMQGDVEAVLWDSFNPERLFISSESGELAAVDARMPGEFVFNIEAHMRAVSSLGISPHVPGMLMTGSTDKSVKVWDVSSEPKLVVAKDLKLGKIYSGVFNPDIPLTVACAGSKGTMKLFSLDEMAQVDAHFGDRVHAAPIAEVGNLSISVEAETDDGSKKKKKKKKASASKAKGEEAMGE